MTAHERAVDETELGKIFWHCSDEDSGPDVGRSLGLGNGRSLWFGDITEARYEDAGPEAAALGTSCGTWIILYGPAANETVVLGKAIDGYVGEDALSTIAAAIRTAAAALPADEWQGYTNREAAAIVAMSFLADHDVKDASNPERWGWAKQFYLSAIREPHKGDCPLAEHQGPITCQRCCAEEAKTLADAILKAGALPAEAEGQIHPMKAAIAEWDRCTKEHGRDVYVSMQMAVAAALRASKWGVREPEGQISDDQVEATLRWEQVSESRWRAYSGKVYVGKVFKPSDTTDWMIAGEGPLLFAGGYDATLEKAKEGLERAWRYWLSEAAITAARVPVRSPEPQPGMPALRWEGDNCYLGTLYVGSVCSSFCWWHAHIVGVDADENIGRFESPDLARAAVEREVLKRLGMPAPAAMLWCCHIRGPDDMVPTQSYQEALALADEMLKFDRRPDIGENGPYASAVPALWPYGPEAHAEFYANRSEPDADYPLPAPPAAPQSEGEA